MWDALFPTAYLKWVQLWLIDLDLLMTTTVILPFTYALNFL